MNFPKVLDPVPLHISNTIATHAGECLHAVVNMCSLGKTKEENEAIYDDIKSALIQIDINTFDLRGEHNFVTFGMMRLNHYFMLKKLIEKMEEYCPELKDAVMPENNITIEHDKIMTIPKDQLE